MLVIVDYKAGNLTSVRLAFAALGVPATIASDPAVVRQATRVVFPGVGAAGTAMAELQRLELGAALRDVVARGVPFFGICLGTQILFAHSEEDGGTDCLGLLPGRVRRFRPTDPYDKIPQIGWNAVHQARVHPVFAGVEDDSEFYFVHSFYPDPADAALALGWTEYAGVRFASAVARGNLVATQFHPERSGRLGLRLLENFSRWEGTC